MSKRAHTRFCTDTSGGRHRGQGWPRGADRGACSPPSGRAAPAAAALMAFAGAGRPRRESFDLVVFSRALCTATAACLKTALEGTGDPATRPQVPIPVLVSGNARGGRPAQAPRARRDRAGAVRRKSSPRNLARFASVRPKRRPGRSTGGAMRSASCRRRPGECAVTLHVVIPDRERDR